MVCGENWNDDGFVSDIYMCEMTVAEDCAKVSPYATADELASAGVTVNPWYHQENGNYLPYWEWPVILPGLDV